MDKVVFLSTEKYSAIEAETTDTQNDSDETEKHYVEQKGDTE